ncbi:uncharacterized protein LOC134851004 isoform X2 [Symsagittifera roscoffensis]|uniref:uncharacterized protein LOC134851004 isoform X2 n=1 Tax=Symsagittifera roscoffensis TaxID=84072 RepID=UPI00307BD43C
MYSQSNGRGHQRVVKSESPLTSGQYRVSTQSVLKGKPQMGAYRNMGTPLSFIYYKDKAEQYYSTTDGFKILQRPKSAGANLTSRGYLRNYYVHENNNHNKNIAVGSEISGACQEHVHRLLCSESRLFTSRPPSPVASLVYSMIKEQQTDDPNSPSDDNHILEGRGNVDHIVINCEAGNDDDCGDQELNGVTKGDEGESRPKRHLEMFIPQVETEQDAEESAEKKSTQPRNLGGNDKNFVADTYDSEELDYQNIDWENAEPVIDPECIHLEALLSPLNMSPSLREVTNAYAQNLFTRQTAPSIPTEKYFPYKAYSKPGYGIRAYENVKPGYSSVIDQSKHAKPPRPDSKQIAAGMKSTNNNESDRKCSNGKDSSKKPGDLRSVSALSIASLTFFDDLNPESDTHHDLQNSNRSSYSNLGHVSRAKSANVPSSNSKKNGVIRKQAKLRGITGVEIKTRTHEPETKSYTYHKEFTPAESTPKKLTTITFGSKDTTLENGYILHSASNRGQEANSEGQTNGKPRPRTAHPSISSTMHTENVDQLTRKVESWYSHKFANSSVKDYSQKAKFPNRTAQNGNLRARVKSAPLTPTNRTVVKVQYEPDTELGSLVLISKKNEPEKTSSNSKSNNSRPNSSKSNRSNVAQMITPRPVFKPLSSATDRSRTHLVQAANHQILVAPKAAVDQSTMTR